MVAGKLMIIVGVIYYTKKWHLQPIGRYQFSIENYILVRSEEARLVVADVNSQWLLCLCFLFTYCPIFLVSDMS